MQTMAILRRSARWRCSALVSCLALGLSLWQGCARSQPLHPANLTGDAGGKQQLPFHSGQEQLSASPGASAMVPDSKLTNSLPFPPSAHTRILPAGTLLTVELQGSLSPGKARPGDSFEASLAAPLIVEGDTLIDLGTEVTGRVEAAQSHLGSGYVRLSLSSIDVGGVPLPLQTSSLFARATRSRTASNLNVSSGSDLSSAASTGVRVQNGRRLTFRLTAPLTLADPISPNSPRAVNTPSQ